MPALDLSAPSAAPPNALRMWTDGIRIYVELPGLRGPYIVTYLYSESGLARALDLLGQRRADYEYLGTIPDNYLKPSKEPSTHNSRSAAEALLRRMGVIK